MRKILFVLLLLTPNLAWAADYPSYLVLRTPKSPHRPAATYGYYPGRAQEVTAQGYAYGWFGVSPRQHWSRHFGTSRNYTQWSAR